MLNQCHVGAVAPGLAALAGQHPAAPAPLCAAGATPFVVAPTLNDEDPAGRPGLHGVAQSVSQHCGPDDAQRNVEVETEQSDKALATLRAEMTMRGLELHIVSDSAGGTAYMLQRWALHRTLTDLAGVREFAKRAGVSR